MRNEGDSKDESIKNRYGARPLRQVGRTASTDFLHWTQAVPVLEGMDENYQIYSMPVFKHNGVYLGLPLIPNSDFVADYDWGCAYSAAYPIFLEDEIRLYYGGSNWLHFGWRDGFSIDSIPGRAVNIEFVINGARLYSFGFENRK